jgi:hypothetical protein
MADRGNRKGRAGPAGRQSGGWRPRFRDTPTALKAAEWTPPAGCVVGLVLGCLISLLVVGRAENSAGAIAGVVFGSIGGAIGGWMMGSSYREMIRDSVARKQGRP